MQLAVGFLLRHCVQAYGIINLLLFLKGVFVLWRIVLSHREGFIASFLRESCNLAVGERNNGGYPSAASSAAWSSCCTCSPMTRDPPPPDAKSREAALSTAHNLGQGYSDSLLVPARQPCGAATICIPSFP
jgi:hypothetical protein